MFRLNVNAEMQEVNNHNGGLASHFCPNRRLHQRHNKPTSEGKLVLTTAIPAYIGLQMC